jgi:putative transcriptional regulator
MRGLDASLDKEAVNSGGEMPPRTYNKAANSLRGAIAVVRKQSKAPAFFVLPEVDVRAIREKLNLSQEDFASAFGFSVHQMRLWEQGRSRPLAAIRAYLMIINRAPNDVLELLHEAVDSKRKIA